MPEGYRVKVRLGGEEFLLKIREQSPYVETAVSRVERDFAELARRHPSLPRHRVAFLVALNLAYELGKAAAEKDAVAAAATPLQDRL